MLRDILLRDVRSRGDAVWGPFCLFMKKKGVFSYKESTVVQDKKEEIYQNELFQQLCLVYATEYFVLTKKKKTNTIESVLKILLVFVFSTKEYPYDFSGINEATQFFINN